MPKGQAKTRLPGEVELIARARNRDEAAVKTLIRQNNQRLFRLARSIMKDDSEAEDVVQESYVRGFTRLDEFRGEASLGTWLTRIVINEAYGRLRRRRITVNLDGVEAGHGVAHGIAHGVVPGTQAQIIPFPSPQPDPERAMAQSEINQILERAIDALPEPFRIVLVARLVEEMSIEETAALLDLQPATVKTRLHRARRLLRDDLERQVGPMLTDVFPFAGARCERMADAVIARLRLVG
jgi:RNA polymerase sigma-70 factor (ECF subfamily)